ncbi:GspMb/PilO family protein [Sphingomonas japonica]|uniref:Type II secretion system (T2SS), protein M subtype b n=1 Tax=Sphingomonas japonica TaxID=511662 RepID=A0ABX0TXS0_9SPHN|nr:GspMb/PilO family protein [Sphingomonas japonica]NIJ23114.1 hypothetical protein [Sphingomonas japonica]
MALRPIWIAAIAGAAAAAWAMPSALDTATRAAADRGTLATALALEATASPPLPTLAKGSAIPARDPATAAAMLQRRLRMAATQGGLLVERAATLPPPGTGTVAVEIAVSGSEKAVIAYADALARARPVAAFFDWEIAAIDQANVRLSGSVVAAWR